MFALGPYLFALESHLRNARSLEQVLEAALADIRAQSLGAVHHYVATVCTSGADQDWTLRLTAESCDAVVSDMNPQRHTTATRTHSGRSAPVAAAGHSPGAYTCWKRSMCAYT